MGRDTRAPRELDRYDALELVCSVERMLARPPAALGALARALATPNAADVVAIDDCVGEAIDAIDPVLEPEGLAARRLLRGLRVYTRRQAAGVRSANVTVRRRAVV
jgi:hypothetical protein